MFSLGSSRKYQNPYHSWYLGFLKGGRVPIDRLNSRDIAGGRGGGLNWNFEGMGIRCSW